MMNDENTLADGVKGWLRDRGMTKSNLKSYKYWLPYTVAGGKAWTPQSMTFELTLRCNLSCQMCPLDIPRMMHNKTDSEYIKERKRAEVTTEEVKKTIDDIAEMGVEDMTITGGEVFLISSIIRCLPGVLSVLSILAGCHGERDMGRPIAVPVPTIHHDKVHHILPDLAQDI